MPMGASHKVYKQTNVDCLEMGKRGENVFARDIMFALMI